MTDALTFDEVMALFESAFEVLRDTVVHEVTGAEGDWVIYGKNTLSKNNLEEVQRLHLNSEGLIDKMAE